MLRPTLLAIGLLSFCTFGANSFKAAPQKFQQEMSRHLNHPDAGSAATNQLIYIAEGKPWLLKGGRWYQPSSNAWQLATESAMPGLDLSGIPKMASSLKSLLRNGKEIWVVTTGLNATEGSLQKIHRISPGRQPPQFPDGVNVHQLAINPRGVLFAATSAGAFMLIEGQWTDVIVRDSGGRDWGRGEILAMAVDSQGNLWMASRAGVIREENNQWIFYEGKDGLPYNEFTAMAIGPNNEVWLATRMGVIRFEKDQWHYRQGPRWLIDDEVLHIACDADGNAWCTTAKGVSVIERKAMTLAEKAEHYEQQIEKHIKRTPFGFVAEAPLSKPGDLNSADPQDSDNDGLWTAMYGAGEAFSYGATRSPAAKERARKAFEALRFLQKVTQGGLHSPPKGYVARTIRPVSGPDPNIGRLQSDKEDQKGDALWKAYEPRWPKSADGRWYWKSDTSSDELDGHFFFYPIYYDLCAESPQEKARVREVVKDLADHLIQHDFSLIDHDGKPTRWGVFGPKQLNGDPHWWPERGLNSLSILSYMAVAAHVTGDAKYEKAARELIDHHGYAQNIMFPKVQNGAGSGNQSDDEMAFMCFYTLLRYSKDEALKNQVRFSFYRYWLNEFPEMNPFFNYAFAAHQLNAEGSNTWGRIPLSARPGWDVDAMESLTGFSLDRRNWSHRNTHRLDLQSLALEKGVDIFDTREQRRGYRVNGKVLPVENRHFNHWNTDPWTLNYGGSGNELAAGTVYLLPYYMGMYHGFVEKP